MVEVTTLCFPEVFLIKRPIFTDDRGFFSELFRKISYAEAGIDLEFVQDNVSVSKKNVIRGMHFQSEPGQGKLVTCLSGEIYDVFVDIRRDSPNFGKWGAHRLKGKSGEQLFIPAGFAHGFASLSNEALLMYKVTSPYNPETERGFCHDDPTVRIDWPIQKPILSDRDRNAPSLIEVIKRENLDLRCRGTAR